MFSIQLILSQSAAALQTISNSAMLDAEVLLCHSLQKNRSYLRTWPEKKLNLEQYTQFKSLLALRRQGTPIAYITGHREFWSRDFLVTPDVLIPRPDTETLIECCLHLIAPEKEANLIDLGTGSGIIAIILSLECPLLTISASDSSATALKVAKENAINHHVSQINFIKSHWFEQIPPQHFDFIISNPPYIDQEDIHLTQGDLRFEPSSALIAANKGLQDIVTISEQSRKYLKKGGYLVFEHGYNQKRPVHHILSQYNYQNIHCVHDLSGHARVTYAQW